MFVKLCLSLAALLDYLFKYSVNYYPFPVIHTNYINYILFLCVFIQTKFQTKSEQKKADACSSVSEYYDIKGEKMVLQFFVESSGMQCCLLIIVSVWVGTQVDCYSLTYKSNTGLNLEKFIAWLLLYIPCSVINFWIIFICCKGSWYMLNICMGLVMFLEYFHALKDIVAVH